MEYNNSDKFFLIVIVVTPNFHFPTAQKHQLGTFKRIMVETPHLVEWAIASHGMYKSALVFFFQFKFKTEELVHSELCAM